MSRGLDINALEGIALTLAGWLRYLSGTNDSGEQFELSPDPLLSAAQAELAVSPDKLLSNTKIFGADLFTAGLVEKILYYYNALSGGVGAVRKTLHEFRVHFGDMAQNG
jgi:fructuronate reductase